MKFISHRGNLAGRQPEMENKPEYIDIAIDNGFDVEIDVWKVNDKMYLGHDSPQYEVEYNYFINRAKSLWCHAKNIEALHALSMGSTLNAFWHQTDDYTITTKGYIWTYPDKKMLKTVKQIILLFDIVDTKNLILGGGICSDYIYHYKTKLS